ncbi:MAG: hypothetical protein ACI9Y7_000723 [Dokdonia sp.]|jgi:hypothetical protein
MEIIQITFSFILVSATIIYVYFTHKLVEESKLVREASIKPYIIIYLESNETNPSGQYIVIKNVGKGLATDVCFNIIKDLDITHHLDRTIEGQGFLNRKYSNFPPDYTFKNHAFELANDHKHKTKSHIVIKCTYTDILNNKYSEIFNLNLKDGFGSSKMTPPDTYVGMISYRIEKLQNSIETLVKNNTSDSNK